MTNPKPIGTHKRVIVQFICFIVLFFLSLYSIKAQELYSKSPGVSTTEKFMQNPSLFSFTDYSNQQLVDLYTGMIDVTLPIYEINEKELKIPISLNYRRPGIKVNEDAGWVGLGWDLVVGGQLIREIQGNPDELIMAINPENGNKYIENLGRFHDLVDVTHYNEEFPLGNTGGENVMDDYVEILKTNAVFDCFTYRYPFAEKPDCEISCQYALVAAISQNPFASELRTSGASVPLFWNRFRDTQPDIFHYSIPGASGSFILDKKGEPKIIKGSTDVLIKPGIGPLSSLNKWEIITKEGIVHEFPTTEAFTEVSKRATQQAIYAVGFLGYTSKDLSKQDFKAIPSVQEGWNGEERAPRVENKVINTWYIHKMYSVSSNAEITFEYQSQADIEKYFFVEDRLDYVLTKSKTYSEHNNIFTCSQEEIQYTSNNVQYFENSYLYPTNTGENIDTSPELHSRNNTSSYFPVLQTLENPKSLYRIHFSNGTVEFELNSQPRNDLAGNYSLKRIKLINKLSEIIKEFEFDYTNFLELPYVNLGESTRLKLVGLEEKAIKVGSSNSKIYQFEYEKTNLPNQFSNKQDYWGFFNNNLKNTLLPNGNRFGVSFEGADRSPDENNMKGWMLKKITYPTGGYNEFFYEINKYRDKEYNLENSIGGLRVSKTVTHDGESISNDIIKEYTYGNLGFSSGRTVHFLDINWWRFFQNDAIYTEYRTDKTLLEHWFIKRSSEQLHEFENTKGSLVGYGKVTVEQKGNGRTDYHFTNPEDYPDEEGNKIKYPYRNQSGSDLYHENSHISKDALRGLLKEKRIYKEDGTLVKSEVNYYENNPPNYPVVTLDNLKIENEYVSDFHIGTTNNTFPFDVEINRHYLMDFGSINSYFPFISKTIISDYNMDGSSKIITTNEYKKNSFKHMQLTSQQLIDSKGNLQKVLKYYSKDGYPLASTVTNWEQDAINKMVLQNRIELIFLETYIDNSITSRLKYVFENHFGDLVNLKSTLNTKGEEDFTKLYECSYDSTGNLVQVISRGNVSSCYIWGYNSQYPVAKVENATLSDIMATGFNQSILNNPNSTDIQKTTELNKLRSLLKAMVTTFTYHPLVGITSITDPKGLTQTLYYDDLNRLEIVKDHEGNIISENKYNYKIWTAN